MVVFAAVVALVLADRGAETQAPPQPMAAPSPTAGLAGEVELEGNSDHASFEDAGIPAGGIFTGLDDC